MLRKSIRLHVRLISDDNQQLYGYLGIIIEAKFNAVTGKTPLTLPVLAKSELYYRPGKYSPLGDYAVCVFILN
jgi:hypothetical protein